MSAHRIWTETEFGLFNMSTVCGHDSHFKEIWNKDGISIRTHIRTTKESLMLAWELTLRRDMHAYGLQNNCWSNRVKVLLRNKRDTCLLLRSAVVIFPLSKETMSCLCWSLCSPLQHHWSLKEACLKKKSLTVTLNW